MKYLAKHPIRSTEINESKVIVQTDSYNIQIENYNDLKPGDIIEPFEVKETKRTLETS